MQLWPKRDHKGHAGFRHHRWDPKRDLINALGGDDIIRGFEGNDFICAGPGADTIYAGPGSRDVIMGGDGADRIHGGPGGDVIVDGRGADYVFAGPGGDGVFGPSPGADHVFLGLGSDYAEDSRGNDVVAGGDGEDLFQLGFFRHAGRDLFRGGPGSDMVSYGASQAAIINLTSGRALTTSGRDRLNPIEDAEGGFGDDTLIGNAASNRIDGTKGDDHIEGRAGDDTVDGWRLRREIPIHQWRRRNPQLSSCCYRSATASLEQTARPSEQIAEALRRGSRVSKTASRKSGSGAPRSPLDELHRITVPLCLIC